MYTYKYFPFIKLQDIGIVSRKKLHWTIEIGTLVTLFIGQNLLSLYEINYKIVSGDRMSMID